MHFGTTSLNSENPFNADSITLLAPDIVEAILDGRQPADMTLAILMQPFAVGWREQVEGYCDISSGSSGCPVGGRTASDEPLDRPKCGFPAA